MKRTVNYEVGYDDWIPGCNGISFLKIASFSSYEEAERFCMEPEMFMEKVRPYRDIEKQPLRIRKTFTKVVTKKKKTIAHNMQSSLSRL